jgi:hypothetical protein
MIMTERGGGMPGGSGGGLGGGEGSAGGGDGEGGNGGGAGGGGATNHPTEVGKGLSLLCSLKKALSETYTSAPMPS